MTALNAELGMDAGDALSGMFMEVEEAAIANDSSNPAPVTDVPTKAKTALPLYFNEPKALDRLLSFANESDGSDVHIGGEEPIRMRVHGKLVDVTSRPISSNEAFDLLVQSYGNNQSAEARIRAGDRVDTSYECTMGEKRTRWRVNASARMKRATPDLRIVLRRITSLPPSVEDVYLDKRLIEVATNLQKGMCIVTGPTGSGKSTTLAAILRYRIENPNDHCHIVTLEAPIEYSYDDVVSQHSVVTQIEIGLNLPSFHVGVENALRQDPDVILVGESRDHETINASLLAAQTGHALYTTSHDNGVANTMRRMLRAFPANEREVAQLELTSALHLVLSQRLVPSTDGKRVALREWLIFDAEVKNMVRSADDVYVTTQKALREYGKPMVVDAKEYYDQGRISIEEFKKIESAARLEGGLG